MAGREHIPYWLRVVFAQAFVAGVLLPAAAPAQLIPPTAAPAQQGYYLTPSLSVTEVYDDNVFFTPSPRTNDFFTRISPGLKAGYQSAPLTVEGGYTFDSEIYSRHSELTDPQVRQQGSLAVKATPIQVLTLAVSGAYFQTKTPTELNLLTGLAARRVLAERYTANPAFTYRANPVTTVKGDYAYSKDLVSGGITTDSHIESLTLDHRLSRRDTVGPEYVGRQFAFSGFPALTSHAFTLGWSHELTPLTTFTLRAGPRMTDGKVDDQPEALTSIRHKLQHGELSFTYTNSVTTIIGQTGSATAQGFAGVAAYDVTSRLRASVRPSVFRVSSQSFTSTVYVINLEATYQLNKWLSLTGSHLFSIQLGSFNPQTGPTGPTTVEVLHNIFLIRLTITYPARVD